MTSHSRTYTDRACQLIPIMHRPARIPHFSLAIISVTVQLWTYLFWVISVYFAIRNTLPKSGTYLLGHPVYWRNSMYICRNVTGQNRPEISFSSWKYNKNQSSSKTRVDTTSYSSHWDFLPKVPEISAFTGEYWFCPLWWGFHPSGANTGSNEFRVPTVRFIRVRCWVTRTHSSS
jgi:hypothetical protein